MTSPGALQVLDLVVAAAVGDMPRAAPPASPAVGACYLVAASATGDWAGKDGCLAGWTSGGWRFVAPREGMAAYVVALSQWALYRGGAWEIGALRGDKLILGGQQVVGARGAAIAAPTGGTTIDSEGRTSIGQILSALRSHGLIDS